ncbi:hypothetical protein [Hymenobacter sp. BT190]|uniref:hypothetical protein n=1 Tax=Hymenobacter sp. BT190 TaxID=2763505 RepID=UPI001650EF7D|nr:hypothetical protein [Hymenobacter sp. BT190]MBC6698612.1 hypothetical protein [Hymenobacter sp. BT190]
MRKYIYPVAALPLLPVIFCLASCNSNPSTSKASDSQPPTILPTTQAAVPIRPDYPGGRGFGKPADKIKLKDLTRNYAAVHFPGSTRPSEEDPKIYYVAKDTIAKILAQTGCIGIRIYPAYKNRIPPYKPRMIIVGVEIGPSGKNRDMDANYTSKQLVPIECTVIETDDKCPDNCDGTAF